MRVYQKHFSNRSALEIVFMAKNSEKLFLSTKDECRFRFPKVIGWNCNSIWYEHLNLGLSLSDLGVNVNFNVFEELGGLLGRLNAVGLRHGDFVTHNIFISEEVISIIDSHVPENLSFSETLYSKDLFLDYYTFKYSYLSNSGLINILFAPRKMYKAIKLFGTNYCNYVKPKLQPSMGILLKNIWLQKKNNGINIFHRFFHVLFYFLLICLID